MSDIDALFQEAEQAQEAGYSGDMLAALSALINTQIELEDKLNDLERQSDETKFKLREISEKRIPELMLSLNIKTITHESGAGVSCEKYYAGSISEERAPAAFAWLRDNDLDSLIKRSITVDYGKGEDEAADMLSAELEEKGLGFKDKASVHPQTLKALIKERIEGGLEMPTDIFGVVTGMKTKIKRPKT